MADGVIVNGKCYDWDRGITIAVYAATQVPHESGRGAWCQGELLETLTIPTKSVEDVRTAILKHANEEA